MKWQQTTVISTITTDVGQYIHTKKSESDQILEFVRKGRERFAHTPLDQDIMIHECDRLIKFCDATWPTITPTKINDAWTEDYWNCGCEYSTLFDNIHSRDKESCPHCGVSFKDVEYVKRGVCFGKLIRSLHNKKRREDIKPPPPMVGITRQSHPKLYWHIDKFLDYLLDGTNFDKTSYGKVAGEDAYVVADLKGGEVDSHERQLAKMAYGEALLLTESPTPAEGARQKELIEKYHLQDFELWMWDLAANWQHSKEAYRGLQNAE